MKSYENNQSNDACEEHTSGSPLPPARGPSWWEGAHCHWGSERTVSFLIPGEAPVPGRQELLGHFIAQETCKMYMVYYESANKANKI